MTAAGGGVLPSALARRERRSLPCWGGTGVAVWDSTGAAVDRRTMPEAARERRIGWTVRRVRGYWYRAGVPAAERRRKAEELRTRLVAASEEGRDVRDVVGDDLPAFAAEWVQADRARPWVEPVLSLLAAVTLVPGAAALLGPHIVVEQDRPGLPVDLAALLAIAVLASLAVQLLRWFRAKLDPRQATIIGVLIGVAAVGAWMGLVPRLADTDRLLVVPATVAWSLVVAGVVAQALLSWSKRTGRL